MTFFYRHPFPTRLLLFILLSLLLHLVLAYLGPKTPPATETRIDEPVYVELRPLEETRETVDVAQNNADPVDTHRLGAAEQKVDHEQAPEGYDLEDSAPHMPEPAPVLQPQEQPKAVAEQHTEHSTQAIVEQTTPVPEPAVTAHRDPDSPPTEPEPEPDTRTASETLPDLQQLLNSSIHAAADVARETRIKQRPDVARGNVVWLNMKHDLLFSFFARFKKGIYGVWNYPQESVERGEEGILLLEIIVNRDGSIEDVNLLSGSEFERLNREAIAAVFKAAPYGKLPESYPEEQLRIKAYFHYQLGARPQIFGR